MYRQKASDGPGVGQTGLKCQPCWTSRTGVPTCTSNSAFYSYQRLNCSYVIIATGLIDVVGLEVINTSSVVCSDHVIPNISGQRDGILVAVVVMCVSVNGAPRWAIQGRSHCFSWCRGARLYAWIGGSSIPLDGDSAISARLT